ncbi:MAG: uracil-DNA glycosylase family protein [Sedimentitalea sp.]
MLDDFETLSCEMRSCTACEGLELGPKPIFQLSPDARVLIVGQAPGRLAHQKGQPFDDPSGDRLRIWMGVSREAFYDDPRIGIFPMGLCFPGKAKAGDKPPRPECAPLWRQKMLAHLSNVALTLVIGRYAIDWHLPDARKSTVAEAVFAPRKAKQATFVLPHPSPRNTLWLKRHPSFERDIVPNIRAQIKSLLS